MYVTPVLCYCATFGAAAYEISESGSNKINFIASCPLRKRDHPCFHLIAQAFLQAQKEITSLLPPSPVPVFQSFFYQFTSVHWMCRVCLCACAMLVINASLSKEHKPASLKEAMDTAFLEKSWLRRKRTLNTTKYGINCMNG